MNRGEATRQNVSLLRLVYLQTDAESLTRKRRVRRRSRFRRRRSPLRVHKKKGSDTIKRVAFAFGVPSDSRRTLTRKRRVRRRSRFRRRRSPLKVRKEEARGTTTSRALWLWCPLNRSRSLSSYLINSRMAWRFDGERLRK